MNITSKRRKEIKANLDAFLERVRPTTPTEDGAHGPALNGEVELVSNDLRRSFTDSVGSDYKGDFKGMACPMCEVSCYVATTHAVLIVHVTVWISLAVSRSLPEVEAMATCFAAAYTDIRRLLARDCWPRFKVSRFYHAYRTLIEEEAELTHAVSGLGMSERGSVRNRASGPSHPHTGATASGTMDNSTPPASSAREDMGVPESSEAVFSELESEDSLFEH